ncbi:zinc finger CCCH domain-containing protein 6 isoform X2 [Aristolochia californica]|uniref:zinc finger CCCH domain-containing protein 6 isoform X2 n=1 Tax=Aristolochia californica TaxID=171875 RepID=UPI0035D69329
MARSQKSKRVSWPPDVNLCQVRLFLSEDAPSLSGSGSQDHLQAKTSWMLHSMGAGTDDHLPPGFEAPQQSTPRIPIIKWCCPPMLLLSPSWQVVAGEESKEVEAQTQREVRVLEAVYPRPSAIPPNPSVSPDALSYQHGDVGTQLVPITPVEDDDSVDQSDPSPSIGLFETSEMQSFSKSFPDRRNLHPPRDTRSELDVVAAAEPDVVAAATAAFTAIMRTNEAGSLIDRDLLIKILSNPQLIDHLVKDYGTPAPSIQMTTNPVSNPVTASVTMPVSSQPVHINRPESSSTSTATPLATSTFTQPAVSGHFHPLTNTVAPALTMRPPLASTSTMTTSPVVKDINYYKSLIQQHGEEKREAQFGKRLSYHNLGLSMETIQQQNPKARDSRGKIQKPCIYFNTPKGCRHGVNCAYQHDASFQQRVASIPEVQSAKRMKLEGEITGRS